MIDAVDGGAVEGLAEGDIVIDCLTFLAAGYETTSVTLAFATYLLAIHPEAQERLNNEIRDYYEENPVSESNQHLSSLLIQWEFTFIVNIYYMFQYTCIRILYSIISYNGLCRYVYSILSLPNQSFRLLLSLIFFF